MYKEFCHENNGPMKIFWNSYLDMVKLTLCFIRATRKGNWKLHLNCVKDVLPWFFAYDHTNYARYLLYIYTCCILLKKTPTQKGK